MMRLGSIAGESLACCVISPSEFAFGEPTSLVRGRFGNVLLSYLPLSITDTPVPTSTFDSPTAVAVNTCPAEGASETRTCPFDVT